MARNRSSGGADADRLSGQPANAVRQDAGDTALSLKDAVTFLEATLEATGSTPPQGFPGAIWVAFSPTVTLRVPLTDTEPSTTGEQKTWREVSTEVLRRLKGHLAIVEGAEDASMASTDLTPAERELLDTLRPTSERS